MVSFSFSTGSVHDRHASPSTDCCGRTLSRNRDDSGRVPVFPESVVETDGIFAQRLERQPGLSEAKRLVGYGQKA